MAKTIKMKVDKETPDFQDLISQLPEEQRNVYESMGISSFEDLLGLSIMLGIDPDKIEKFHEEHGEDEMPSLEEVMFDDDDPAGDFHRMIEHLSKNPDGEKEDNNDYNDPFRLPETILFENEPSHAYHLRIKLNDAPVPVWREVEVPSNISLEFLAFVIMDAMGWENEHLHQFMTKDTIYKNEVCIRQDRKMFGMFEGRFTTLASDDYPISVLFKQKGDRIKFEYDFGDSWNHDIWLKGIREYQSDEMPCIKILKGKGACPPEDCGGVWGYADLLELKKKKRKSAEDKERLEWYGIYRNYDPEEFDKEWAETNLRNLWEDAME